MPRYDYQCSACKAITEHEMTFATFQSVPDLWCENCDDLTEHRHVLSTPSIGAVPGGGGSPAR